MRSSTCAAVLTVCYVLFGITDASACQQGRFAPRHGGDPLTVKLLEETPTPVTVEELTTNPKFELPETTDTANFPDTRIPDFETVLYSVEAYIALPVRANASAWNAYLSATPDGAFPHVEIAGGADGCGPQSGPIFQAVNAVNRLAFDPRSTPGGGTRVRVTGPLFYRGPRKNFSITPVLKLEILTDEPDGGGNNPPPPPPAPFRIGIPPEFFAAPALMSNSGSQSIGFESRVGSSFSSDLHFSVTSDALEHEDFHVSINPTMFAAPGSGEGEVTITTGPMTFPRTYAVTLTATNGTASYSRAFLVSVTCDPPFILGIDQPKDVSAVNAADFDLEVRASGSGPFFYQWYRGVPGMTRWPIAGGTGPKLTTSAREDSRYWVRISNACGSVDSMAAKVTVSNLLRLPRNLRLSNGRK